jgi:hypothetical protein
MMTEEVFHRTLGGNAPTKNGLKSQWVFGVRRDGSVRAMVQVKIPEAPTWVTVAVKDFPAKDSKLAAPWVRSVLAPYNVEAPDGEEHEENGGGDSGDGSDSDAGD